MAYLGREAAKAPIVTADLPNDGVTLAKMAGGTDGQIITYDASGDPVAVGPGTDGQVLTSTGATTPPAFEDAGGSTDASDLDSGTLGYARFPTGSILQATFDQNTGYQAFNNDTATAKTGFEAAITVKVAGSKILVILTLSASGAETTNDTSLVVRLDGPNSLAVILSEIVGKTWATSTSVDHATFQYWHTHGQSVDTVLTYTPKFWSQSNEAGAFIGNYLSNTSPVHTLTLIEVMP